MYLYVFGNREFRYQLHENGILIFFEHRNQLVHLIENTFRREEVLYFAWNEERAFFASEEHKKYDLWSCQKVTDSLIYLLDNIYIRFCSKLYRQNVGIPMGTNCAPLVADLFLFCCERDFMKKNGIT